ncbi:MAG: hypothetical protein ABI721_00720 [Candidatus Dojkabacteria bacterium]
MQEETKIMIGITGGNLIIDWDKKEVTYKPKTAFVSSNPEVIIPFENLVSAKEVGNIFWGLLSRYGDYYYVQVSYKSNDGSVKSFNFVPVSGYFKNVFAVSNWANKLNSIAIENKEAKSLKPREIKGEEGLIVHEKLEDNTYRGIGFAIIVLLFVTIAPLFLILCCGIFSVSIVSLLSSVR